MAAAAVLTSIGILFTSFIIGYFTYYFTRPLEKDKKKKQLEEITSLLINFIIYVWVGKIIANINLFVQDPLSVLAYPSNSTAFYIAVLLIILNIMYKVKRHSFEPNMLLYAFVPIFLISSFVYELIQFIVEQSVLILPYLSLLLVLVILTLLERMYTEKNLYFLVFVWTIGQILLSLIMPFTRIFGFIVHPLFFIITFISLLSIFILTYKRKVSSWVE